MHVLHTATCASADDVARPAADAPPATRTLLQMFAKGEQSITLQYCRARLLKYASVGRRSEIHCSSAATFSVGKPSAI
jgi:hypothetical protein